jgi:hypothetical protein
MAPTLLFLVDRTDVRDRNGPWRLFDNEADWLQPSNRANQETLLPVQAALDAQRAAVLARQGDAFESPAQRRQRWGYAVDDVEAAPDAA